MPDNRQLCTFWVGDLFLGVDVTHVQEVVRPQALTTVPLAPPVVRGLINLRGQIVTAIDLAQMLDLPDRADGVELLNVVIRSRGEAISLLVDAIGDVVEIADDACAPVPPTVRTEVRRLLQNTCPLPGRLLLVLDPDAVTDDAALPSASHELEGASA